MSLKRISTIQTPASSYDLIALADVHGYQNIPNTDTNQDAFISTILPFISEAVQKYCNNPFVQETIQDQMYFDRSWPRRQIRGTTDELMTSRWPVLVQTLTTNAATAAGNVLSFSGTPNIDVGLGAVQANIPAGTVVTGISEAGGITSVTLSNPVSAAMASGTSVLFGPGVTVTCHGTATVLTQNTDFVVDPANGELIRLNPNSGEPRRWQEEPTTIVYMAGYLNTRPFVAVPPDVQDACQRMVSKALQNRGRDPMLRVETEEGLTRQWWIDTGRDGNFPPEVQQLLDAYRVPVAR